MNIAFLIIDMQKCFIEEYGDRRPITECCEYINYVATMVRKAGQTVIHIQDIEDAEAGSEALAFIDEINVESDDLTVQKKASNAFWQTDLEEIVRSRDIDLLILSGQAAEHCVVFTCNGAVERGFNAAILQGGVVSQLPDRVRHLMEDRPTISHPVIRAITS